MGNSSAKYETATEDEEPQPTTSRKKKGKRGKRSASATEDEPSSSTTKIAKLDTTKYVYEKLFLAGEQSDVSILAVGHIWSLHKLYLKQCKYFDALFGSESSWKGKDDHKVKLEFPDGKVTVPALHAVLGSLYSNEIELDIKDIEGILAAASFLQLESILTRCDELMAQNISDDSVLQFAILANRYGLWSVVKKSERFLQYGFWRLSKSPKFLKELPFEALARLLSSSDTLSIEGEKEFYQCTRKWVYLHEGGKVSKNKDDFERSITEFYKANPGSFEKYAALWSGIRVHHLLTSSKEADQLRKDGIIPAKLIDQAMVDCWKGFLRNEEEPNEVNEISEEAFYLCALREGMVVDEDPKLWRLISHNSGLDLLLQYTQRYITIRRNVLSQPTTRTVSINGTKKVYYRIVVTDAKGTQLHDTGRESIELRMDHVVVIARFATVFELPLSVHIFHLSSPPCPPSFLYVNQYLNQLHAKEVQLQTDDDGEESSTPTASSPDSNSNSSVEL